MKAIEYLNSLRSKRINPYTSLGVSDFTTNDALVQFCWDERRRELCFKSAIVGGICVVRGRSRLFIDIIMEEQVVILL